MAYRMAGVVKTVEVRGGSRVVGVNEYHVFSLPSETYFQFRADRTAAQLANVKTRAADIARRIEAVLALATVTDVDYFQDTTRAGRLQDRMRTYYISTDGLIEGDVESDLANFGPTLTGGQISAEISAERARLS